MNALIRGAIGGIAGTAAMTAAMALARMAGAWQGEPPPRKISRRAEKAVDLYDNLSTPTFEASWMTQHVGYGATAGVVYAILDRQLNHPHPAIAGPIFGASLWAFSYAGWLPVVGLYPPPTEDRPDRIAVMIGVHLVYGTVTACAVRALRSPAADRQTAGSSLISTESVTSP